MRLTPLPRNDQLRRLPGQPHLYLAPLAHRSRLLAQQASTPARRHPTHTPPADTRRFSNPNPSPASSYQVNRPSAPGYTVSITGTSLGSPVHCFTGPLTTIPPARTQQRQRIERARPTVTALPPSSRSPVQVVPPATPPAAEPPASSRPSHAPAPPAGSLPTDTHRPPAPAVPPPDTAVHSAPNHRHPRPMRLRGSRVQVRHQPVPQIQILAADPLHIRAMQIRLRRPVLHPRPRHLLRLGRPQVPAPGLMQLGRAPMRPESSDKTH